MFNYSEEELPEVVKGCSYPINDGNEEVTYYDVGSWSMSDLTGEDADIDVARSNALAWIAWYNFLTSKEN